MAPVMTRMNKGEQMSFWKKIGAAGLVVAVLSAAGVAGAALNSVRVRGAGQGAAVLNCPGGMTRLGHPFAEDMSVFPGDPAIHIEPLYTVTTPNEDFFLVEDIHMGPHAGTHLDAPIHFLDDPGTRAVDDLAPDEFVWPVYKIDTSEMTFDGPIPFVEVSHIKAYEAEHGRIPRTGALVVLQTGAEEFWGIGEGDSLGTDEFRGVVVSDNTDDFFDFVNPGFSAEAVQWLFDRRNVDGVGSDAYGPDAFGDENFDATYTALANDGVALVALANLDSVNVRGDIIIASTVALEDGSGFSTDPLACHGVGDDDRYDHRDDDEKK